MFSLTEEQQWNRWLASIQKVADRSLRTGRMSRIEYRDILREALRMVRSRDAVETVGWK